MSQQPDELKPAPAIGQAGPAGEGLPTSYEDAIEVARKIQPSLNKLMLLFHRSTEGSALTTSQVSILNELRVRGPSRVSTIAQVELIRMPTASNALYQLETQGYVRRQRDQSDRRGVLVALTERGEQVLREVSEQRSAALAEILCWLDPQELVIAQQATGVIARLAAAYEPAARYR